MSPRHALFLQATEAGAYPPVISAAVLLADAGWQVTVLSAPVRGLDLPMTHHPGIRVETVAERPSDRMPPRAYAGYGWHAARLAHRLKPAVIYASDPLGSLPGLMARRVAGARARLVYHEHDSPNRNADLNPLIRRARNAALAEATAVVFPNAGRAAAVARDVPRAPARPFVVWNVPRRGELPPLPPQPPQTPLVVYYHGSINPDRLPRAVAEAVASFGGAVVLRIAGYETGEPGHVARLRDEFGAVGSGGVIEVLGQIPRDRLLAEAARAHVGLSLMPTGSDDINMRHMTGASNKTFDFMAAGLALLVSDLTDWRATFVEPGHALAVRSDDPASIAAALRRWLDDPGLRTRMATLNREKIDRDWNYDTQFAPVLACLEQG